MHGRNRRFGREIINKKLIGGCRSIDEVIQNLPSFGYIAEGVVTAKWVKALAAQKKLALPIIEGVYRILNREADPVTELGTMLDLIISRSRSGRRWRRSSALLRGTAEWTKEHLTFGKRP